MVIFRVGNPITQSWIGENCENDVVAWIPIAVGVLDCPAKYFRDFLRSRRFAPNLRPRFPPFGVSRSRPHDKADHELQEILCFFLISG
jgi:hypothetical protein